MKRVQDLDSDISPKVSDLLRVAFCQTLIERASVSFGHQSMSFKKSKEQEALFADNQLVGLVGGAWNTATEALLLSAPTAIAESPEVVRCDARNLTAQLGDERFDCVITSPPYPNRMSYIRELRPYMYWLGYLENGRAAGELDWQAIGGTWGCATSNVGRWAPPYARPIPFEPFESIIAAIGEKSDLLARYVHKYFFDMVHHVEQVADIVARGRDAALHSRELQVLRRAASSPGDLRGALRCGGFRERHRRHNPETVFKARAVRIPGFSSGPRLAKPRRESMRLGR